MNNIELAYEQHLRAFRTTFPAGTEVFAAGRVCVVFGWGFDVDRPYVDARDRRGETTRLYDFEAVEYYRCDRCVSGYYDVHSKYLTGRKCSDCNGTGKRPFNPSSLERVMRLKFISADALKAYPWIVTDMKCYAEFNGFTELTGEPVYKVKFDGDIKPVRLKLKTLESHFKKIKVH